MSWRVLLTDRAWPDSSVEQRELAAVGAELIEAPMVRNQRGLGGPLTSMRS